MELTNNTFIQLREQVAEHQNQPGDFNTQLKKPIVLEEGDQLILQKAIIDSRSIDAGKIVLENDTTLSANFTPYLMLFNADNKYEFGTSAASFLNNASIDGSPYILCRKITTGVKIYKLNLIEVLPAPNVFPKDVDFVATIQYRDIGDTLQTRHIKMERGGFGWSSVDRGLDILARAEGLDDGSTFLFTQPTIDEIQSIGGVVAPGDQNFNMEEVNAGIVYEPQTFTHSVILEKGSYEPSDFAKRVTEAFSQINDQRTYNADVPTDPDNLLLMTTESPSYTDIGANLDERPFINMTQSPQNAQPQRIFSLQKDGSQNYFIGTSQFALEYDPALNSFKFTALHMPFYDGTDDEKVKYRGLFGGTSSFKIQNREMGVILHSLGAEDRETNKPVDIWSGILGFDLAKLCPTPQQVENTHLGAFVPQYVESEVRLGLCFTGGQNGMDTAVKKSVTPIVQGSSGLDTIVSQTTPILADGNFGTNNLSFGYFLVEINGLYNDGVITNTDLKKHIFGVISRYYENENYTSGTTEDALVYTHKGATLYLNQLGVRILDADYTIADGLGTDNTIWLQHLKAIAPPKSQSE